MCGITGFVTRRHSTEAALKHHVTRMADGIRHRGPDSMGAWANAESGVALGHRRLAIVDLSPQGAQPMVSACGRYTMVYNGEIYNHQALRDELAGQTWRGHSDTETMLACFTRWGFAATLGKLVGMFAIAVWDAQDRRLLLARDRLGEKPLYVGRLPCGDFVFASELKALRVHPHWVGEVNRDAITLLLRHNCIPAPHSIYQGIRKLPPAQWLSVDAAGVETTGSYWDLRQLASPTHRHATNTLSDELAIDRLDTLLSDAVRGQMMADVPLGAFLSGGVDSSTIVALMTRHSTQKVRTFAIGFDEAGFNEAVHAKAVAQHLGTDHTELYVSAQQALDVIPRLPTLYDEPFADSSQIPTFLVCAMARQHVTVALSGDGGDELFAGYTRYKLANDLWGKLAKIPIGLRRAMASGVLAVPPNIWQTLLGTAMAVLPVNKRLPNAGDKLHKFAANVLAAPSAAAMYRALVSHWDAPASVVLGASEPSTLLQDATLQDLLADPVERMCLTDQLTYLPDDILVKVDRAGMGVSLEARIPLLDHRVVAFAWQLPLHQKLRDGQSKWLLRQLLYRFVPRSLIERPKQGFAIPLAQWLRGPLRGWAEDLLSEQRLQREGYFNVRAVRNTWQEHLDGRRNWPYLLWDVLMFQAWLQSLQQTPAVPNAQPIRTDTAVPAA
jgi:asparagine synthase (glutamine-hydrolysing)